MSLGGEIRQIHLSLRDLLSSPRESFPLKCCHHWVAITYI
jgi:hypothetical protein